MVDATNNPLSGLWKNTQVEQVYYGPDCVNKHLVDTLPSSSSKAFIITGSSLAEKTQLVSQVEKLLGERHAGTFSKIKQHAPVADLDKATEQVQHDSTIDTIISIGGGSPIDSAKAISYRLNEKSQKYLYHITIPTTLSAAECTMMAGYTNLEGKKVGVAHPRLVPNVIFYDAKFALETPSRLWISTGIRALDHAVETMYHPTASESPARQMAINAVSGLFTHLPKYKEDSKNIDHITNLQLASYGSLGFIGLNLKGGLGLSHSLGYALGSPYGIPHGITSCLTLGHVVKLKAEDPKSAEQLARLLPFIGHGRTGNDEADATKLGDEILNLVNNLGLASRLGDHKVGDDQAPIVAKLATGSDSGVLYDKVLQLVKTLY
ncbi:Dehydroquinate synthase-like protein [Pseudovirgaria hyperparasitica]|uniref:Dehydroquinate synthase-like protein n=1 Tax=Pseudovirgaria hyperparasitica TaxID=470096 RepID=A0A6A6WLF2_9PEZI|nr:Dehydroquinate synthase-like protein [Pseudovirgaria hyperparasitica]KAF2762976.1 Dehydroquinate synthase-like protein [Pseudovirgaria hyperparasitica]